MQIETKEQVFNLFNTNGRRNDIVEAYRIYIDILNESPGAWTRYPASFRQYEFYKSAIARSPEVFKKYSKYDRFRTILQQNETIRANFFNGDVDKLRKSKEGKELLRILDTDIEQRARHYTSNLKTIGFVDERREITEVGRAFLSDERETYLDDLEKMIPIDVTNLTILRQMLKLRVYNSNNARFYLPGILSFLLLVKNGAVREDNFLKIIQILHPDIPETSLLNLDINDDKKVREFFNQYVEKRIGKIGPGELKQISRLEPADIIRHFTNRKSGKIASHYEQFYILLADYARNRDFGSVEKINRFFNPSERNASEPAKAVKKAFFGDVEEFKFSRFETEGLEGFIEENAGHPFLVGDPRILPAIALQEFKKSKLLADVKEYGDTTRRILRATGVISFKNNIVTLKYADIWEKVFSQLEKYSYFVEADVDGDGVNSQYEKEFHRNQTILNILSVYNEEIDSAVQEALDEMSLQTVDEAKNSILKKVDAEFKEFVSREFPYTRVASLLALFSDRSNDARIKREVGVSVSVPTIYEYLIGLAWYHISDLDYDLHSSFNLTLNADFLPEKFAGPGEGDIIVRYSERIVLIEATLMNSYAQKRGEWEPVLRHSVNLVVRSGDTPVHTVFIADQLDENTINIWKAVSAVPLRSTERNMAEAGHATNVKIFPLLTKEVCELLISRNAARSDKGGFIASMLSSIDRAYPAPETFDMNWRSKVVMELNPALANF